MERDLGPKVERDLGPKMGTDFGTHFSVRASALCDPYRKKARSCTEKLVPKSVPTFGHRPCSKNGHRPRMKTAPSPQKKTPAVNEKKNKLDMKKLSFQAFSRASSSGGLSRHKSFL